MSDVQSAGFFKPHWLAWTALGINSAAVPSSPHHYRRRLYRLYSVMLHALISVCYPTQLYLGFIFREGNFFESLALCVTCTSIVLKFLNYVKNLHKVRRMEAVLALLDARVRHREELAYFRRRIRWNMREIAYALLVIYAIYVFSLALLFFDQREGQRLLLPAWFPWDWRASRLKYCLAMACLIVSASAQMVQSYANNSLAPMALCLLSGHIELLYKRVVRIGRSGGADRVADKLELRHCIMDQQHLYNLFDIIEDIIGLPEVLHFTFIAFNMCLVFVSLMFYTDTVFGLIFNVSYLIALLLQLFPICYYGSIFKLNFEQLHYAAFCCNWMEQSAGFKQDMIIFTERSLKITTARAGGLFNIHLDTFFSTCRATYSLICAILSMKK